MPPQPFIPLPDGAQAEVIFSLFGEVVENRLWFRNRTPPTTLDHLQALADGVAGWHVDNILPLLSHELILSTVKATAWDVEFDNFAFSVLSSVPGGNPDASHSANVAVRVRFQSAISPGVRNANFVPGIPLSQVNGNLIVPTFSEQLFDGYVNLIDLAAGFGGFPGWRWVCSSRILSGAYRSEQFAQRTDFISVPSPWVSPRRKRLPGP